MDDIQKRLKETRESGWQEFNHLSADEKLIKLEIIITIKKQNDPSPLAVNLRNFGSNFDSIIFELISKAQSTPSNYYRLMLDSPNM